MITNLFLNLIWAPIHGIFNLLPTAGAGLGINTLATTITTSSYWPSLGWANNYFPLDLTVNLFTVLLGVYFTLLGIRVVVWVYHQFWGSD
jgi:hypothetical protein